MRASLAFALLALFACRKEPEPGETTPTPTAAPKVEPAPAPASAPARAPEPATGAPPASAPPIADEQGGTIAGVRWGEPPAAKDLPDTPVAADIAGAATPIVHAVAARMPDFPDSPLFLDLFVAEPPDACALHIGAGAATPSFSFALGIAPKRDAVVEYHGTSERDAKPPAYARLTLRSAQTGRIRMVGDGDAIVVVDAIDAKRVNGRVYAAFRDPGNHGINGAADVGRHQQDIVASGYRALGGFHHGGPHGVHVAEDLGAAIVQLEQQVTTQALHSIDPPFLARERVERALLIDRTKFWAKVG